MELTVTTPDYSHLATPKTFTDPLVEAARREWLGLITEEELAAAIGIAVPRLGIWRGKGYGPKHVKLGRRIFYRLQDIRFWIDTQADTPDAPDVE